METGADRPATRGRSGRLRRILHQRGRHEHRLDRRHLQAALGPHRRRRRRDLLEQPIGGGADAEPGGPAASPAARRTTRSSSTTTTSTIWAVPPTRRARLLARPIRRRQDQRRRRSPASPARPSITRSTRTNLSCQRSRGGWGPVTAYGGASWPQHRTAGPDLRHLLQDTRSGAGTQSALFACMKVSWAATCAWRRDQHPFGSAKASTV